MEDDDYDPKTDSEGQSESEQSGRDFDDDENNEERNDGKLRSDFSNDNLFEPEDDQGDQFEEPLQFENEFEEITPEEIDQISKPFIRSTPHRKGANIDDILINEEGESFDDFIVRRDLTKKIANIPNFKLNNYTALVMASMMMKKMIQGISYTPEIEDAIDYISSLV